MIFIYKNNSFEFYYLGFISYVVISHVYVHVQTLFWFKPLPIGVPLVESVHVKPEEDECESSEKYSPKGSPLRYDVDYGLFDDIYEQLILSQSDPNLECIVRIKDGNITEVKDLILNTQEFVFLFGEGAKKVWMNGN